jgi:ubiquinone/menaquinone biosynthesis C-methylase UbiE
MQNDYNRRDVDFAKIHATSPLHFDIFFDILHPQPQSHILDIGGGYGSVILEYCKRYGSPNFYYDILEPSKLQVDKGKKMLAAVAECQQHNYINYIHNGFLEHIIPPHTYHQIILKMVFHEFTATHQLEVLRKIHHIIRPGGQLLVWMPWLQEHTRSFFAYVIARKDHHAGFDTMARDRHFCHDTDFLHMAQQAGFHPEPPRFTFEYILDTRQRLAPEFNNNPDTYHQWLCDIRTAYQSLDPGTRQDISCTDAGDHIYLAFKRAIYCLSPDKP